MSSTNDYTERTYRNGTAKPKLSIDERFAKHHTENPHIWEAFECIALSAVRDRNMTRWSAKGVFEILRWNTSIREFDSKFKVSNDFTRLNAEMFNNKWGIQCDMNGNAFADLIDGEKTQLLQYMQLFKTKKRKKDEEYN